MQKSRRYNIYDTKKTHFKNFRDNNFLWQKPSLILYQITYNIYTYSETQKENKQFTSTLRKNNAKIYRYIPPCQKKYALQIDNHSKKKIKKTRLRKQKTLV